MNAHVRTVVLQAGALLSAAACVSLMTLLEPTALAQQSGVGRLAEGVDSGSRNRLPPITREDLDERGRKAYDAAVKADSTPGGPWGAAGIRLHGSGVDVRWMSSLGRQLTELAILTTAREHDQPYEWSLHEMEAVAVGLDPAVIDTVRYRRPLGGLSDKEATVIQIGREIFGTHRLTPEAYARAVELLGTSNLVDIVDLMGSYSATGARLTAVNQQMPTGWRQFLPLPFTPPTDIHEDSRSRLPLIRSQPESASAPPSLYSRGLAPEGTGPTHIRRHLVGPSSLDGSAGRPLTDLAILVTAREHDAQYDWTVREMAAVEHGLDPAVIDVVRNRKPLVDIPAKEAALIAFGRELFGKHVVAQETYARALQLFGERDLLALVETMALTSSDVTLSIAFDQQLPAGQMPRLPMH